MTETFESATEAAAILRTDARMREWMAKVGRNIGGTSLAVTAIYGDGSDGVAAFDGSTTVPGATLSGGNYTLNRDSYYTTATLSGTTKVNCKGFRLFVRGTLTVGASTTLHANGNDGSGSTAGTGGGNSISGLLGFGSDGGNGSSGGGGGTAGGNPQANTCIGATGGAGGAASGGPGTGGGTSSATATPPSVINGLPRNLPQALSGYILAIGNSQSSFMGGTGGSGGSSVASSTGGGGGGAGGVLLVAAQAIVNSGTISANGGIGANASGAGTGAGGGGGGGGGGVILVYNTFTGSAATANGGAGGTAQGAGKNGATGSNGNVYTLVNT